MAYTVKQLAEAAGVSVRTLHWYHKKKLLPPAYVGTNGYRYYEEEQLLLLQQILFFKSLGFPLGVIEGLLAQDAFDKEDTLRARKRLLTEEISHKKTLIPAINQALNSLKGGDMTTVKTIFKELVKEEERVDERTSPNSENITATTLNGTAAEKAQWTQENWLAHTATFDLVYRGLVAAIENGDKPNSDGVQAMMSMHYALACVAGFLDHGAYVELAVLYGKHPEFIAFYAKLHSGLLVFLQSAMRVYADNHL